MQKWGFWYDPGPGPIVSIKQPGTAPARDESTARARLKRCFQNGFCGDFSRCFAILRTTPDRGQSSQETSPGPPRGRANLLRAFTPYLWWRLAQDRDVSRLFDEKNMKNRTAGQPEAVIYGTFAGNAGTPQRTGENRRKPADETGTDS